MMRTNSRKLLVTVFLFSIFAIHQSSFSQVNFIDTIRKSLSVKPTGECMLDGRNSFLTGSKTPMSGVKAGLDFDSKFMIGIGYSWMRDIRNNQDINKTIIANDVVWRQTKMRYLSIYAQYFFYKKNRWKFSIMPQIGFGSAFYSYTYSINKSLNNESKHAPVFIYEPMMSGSFRLAKFCGVGADLGWRFTLKNRKVVKDFLTSPIYSFHFDIYWWTIYKTYFRKKKNPQ